jgi:hypothetical protein
MVHDGYLGIDDIMGSTDSWMVVRGLGALPIHVLPTGFLEN